jgi:hypothetical protein
MIELTLIEDKIFYGVVEEFLFTRRQMNSNFGEHIFYDAGLVKFRDNNLTAALRYKATQDNNANLGFGKSIILKYQDTNNASYKKVIKVYSLEDCEKYLLLL